MRNLDTTLQLNLASNLWYGDVYFVLATIASHMFLYMCTCPFYATYIHFLRIMHCATHTPCVPHHHALYRSWTTLYGALPRAVSVPLYCTALNARAQEEVTAKGITNVWYAGHHVAQPNVLPCLLYYCTHHAVCTRHAVCTHHAVCTRYAVCTSCSLGKAAIP